MTTTAPTERPTTPVEVPTGPHWLLHDSWTEAMRHLRIIPRNIELLIFATIHPRSPASGWPRTCRRA